MFARNTPRRPHPFGWIDLNGRRWSVKGHQDINAYASFFPLRFFRCCFAQNLRSDDPRRSAEVDNAFWGEQLTGANVQFMHLDVTRFASHYIARADVLHLDQCFSAKALTLMRTLMRHMRLLEPAPFSLPLTAFHTPYYTPYRLHSVIHDHASGRLVTHGLLRQSTCHRGGTVTQHYVTFSR